MRLEVVFFGVLRTRSVVMESTISNSTKLSASRNMNTQSTSRGTSIFQPAYLITTGTLSGLIVVTHLLMILPVIMVINMIILLFGSMIRMIHR